MKSGLPKVLHEVCGRPSLWHVLTAAKGARPSLIVVVVGHAKERVEAAVRSWDLKTRLVFIEQEEPLGTGHAVMAAEDAVKEMDEVLIMAGDDPLVTETHVRELLKIHRRTKAAATLLTTFAEDPTGFGRIIREGDSLVGIAEEADAPADILEIREIATLVYAFRREELFKALPLVGRENRLNEYYLHHVLPIMREKGEVVSALPVDLGGALGLNSRAGLAKVVRVMRWRVIERHLKNGVTFVDPDTAYVDPEVHIGPDTVVQPMTVLQGATRIGSGCEIGPATRIVDSTVGDGCEVTFSVVRESRMGPSVTVGPYASLRPGTVIEEGAKAGTFVELKASRIGKGSKVPHLSYVGDARIGEGANIGAGTVTVNYDGFDKYATVIGEGAHIGSDNMLIAPVRIGKNAWTGAGSVITKDVPPGALAVERTEQRIVPGYDERKRAARLASRGKAPAKGKRKGGRK